MMERYTFEIIELRLYVNKMDSEFSGFIFEDPSVEINLDNNYYEYGCMSVEELKHLLENYPD